MQKLQCTTIFLLLYLCTLSIGAAEAPWKKAETLLSESIRTNDPGVAVLVAQDGKILLEKSYGLADLEHDVPVTPQTIFRIASITKNNSPPRRF